MRRNLDVQASEAKILRSLHGMAFSFKKTHTMPINMNTVANKEKRKSYVEALLLMERDKHIIWMDETNFNLFCRRNYGRFN